MSLVSDVQLLLDESGGAVFFPIERVYDALNEAQLETIALDAQTTVGTFTADPDSDLVTLPAEVMIPKKVLGTNSVGQTVEYYPTSQVQLEQADRWWRLKAPSYPMFFVLWDMEHLRTFPRADDAYLFTVEGIGWPTEIDASHLDLTLSRYAKEALVYHAAAKLLEDTQPTAAQRLTEEAVALERKHRAQLRNRGGHNLGRLRPGTIYDRAHAISIGKYLR